METKENQTEIVSSNYKVNLIINELKEDKKNYLKLIKSLEKIGVFTNNIEVSIYEDTVDDIGRKVKLMCSDLNNDLFVFYGMSYDRTDSLKITKVTNEKETNYDFSLEKKGNISLSSIKYVESGKVLSHKFGRLVTNDIDFFTILLGGGVGYQIRCNFNMVISTDLLCGLNKMDHSPNLNDILMLFNEILTRYNIQTDRIDIYAFKDFNTINTLSFDCKSNKETNVSTLKRTKKEN